MFTLTLTRKAAIVAALAAAVLLAPPPAEASESRPADLCASCADNCFQAGFACFVNCNAGGNGCQNVGCYDYTGYHPIYITCG